MDEEIATKDAVWTPVIPSVLDDPGRYRGVAFDRIVNPAPMVGTVVVADS